MTTKNPDPDEEVTFTLTLKNEGTVPYTHLSVTYGGEDMGFASTKLNPGEEKSHSYTMSFTTSTEVQFYITLRDHEGEDVSISSNTISILLPVDPDVLQSSVQLTMSPDVSQLSSPGTITFTGLISNDSEYILSDVLPDRGDTGQYSRRTRYDSGEHDRAISTSQSISTKRPHTTSC